MDLAAQERASGQDNSTGRNMAAIGRPHPDDPPAVEQQPDHLALANRQPRLLGEQVLHRFGIELPIGLGARPLDRRALLPVECAKLNTAAVDGLCHDTIEGVDLANQVATAEPADRRVAGHRADRGNFLGEQEGARTHPGTRGSSLGASMAAADHDHIKTLHARLCAPSPDERQASREQLHRWLDVARPACS